MSGEDARGAERRSTGCISNVGRLVGRVDWWWPLTLEATFRNLEHKGGPRNGQAEKLRKELDYARSTTARGSSQKEYSDTRHRVENWTDGELGSQQGERAWYITEADQSKSVFPA